MIPSPIFFPPLPPFLVKFQNPDGSVDYYSYFSSLAQDSANLKLFQELSCLQQIQQIGAFFPHPFHFDSFKENNYFDENKKENESLDFLPIDLRNNINIRKKRKSDDEIREIKKYLRPKKIQKRKEHSYCLFIQPVLENLSILRSSSSSKSAPCSPSLPSRYLDPGHPRYPNHWPKPGWDDEIISQIEKRRARKYIETCLKQLKKHFNKRFKYRSRNTDDLRVQLMKHRCMNEIFEALEYFLEVDKIREQHLAESKKNQRCVSR
ncbi:hypothetical protein FO519_006148 [Halicephalobus sp. NKZ332]|nr:hypothetical protein FO519_006148 [Halicephalobus sp. NKZ332]